MIQKKGPPPPSFKHTLLKKPAHAKSTPISSPFKAVVVGLGPAIYLNLPDKSGIS